jgi:hypothetical protein
MLIDFSFNESDSISYRISYQSKLYQRVSDVNSLTFTSNNNLSLRLRPDDLQPYDDSMRGGEDMYVCLKLAKKNYKYLVDRELKIYHKARDTKKGLLKQFYNYGRYGCDALKSLELKYLEIFYCFNLSNEKHKLLVKLPSPIKGLIHINIFTLHILLLLCSLVFLNSYLFGLSLSLMILELIKERELIKDYGLIKAIKVFTLKYLVNVSFFLGGLIEFPRTGILFIPLHIHRSSKTPKKSSKLFFLKDFDKSLKNAARYRINNLEDNEAKIVFIGKNMIRVTDDNISMVLHRTPYVVDLYFVKDIISFS